MRRLQNYFRDVILELRKVTWPTRDELWGATGTVFVFAFISAVFVWLVDMALGAIVETIVTLATR